MVRILAAGGTSAHTVLSPFGKRGSQLQLFRQEVRRANVPPSTPSASLQCVSASAIPDDNVVLACNKCLSRRGGDRVLALALCRVARLRGRRGAKLLMRFRISVRSTGRQHGLKG